jgi:predicted enzyme related to lactoylglutathione lyase
MEKVTGIGGVFFKAREPERLAAWYQEHLGVPVKEGCADFCWREKDKPDQIGRTVWALFPTDTEHFGNSGSSLMINYRVSDLDRMLEQLRQRGVLIEKIEEFDYGRFAWLKDPEGNRIELWEPKGEA